MKLSTKIIFFLGLFVAGTMAAAKAPMEPLNSPLNLKLDSRYDRDPILDGRIHPVYRLRWDPSQRKYYFTPISPKEFQANVGPLAFLGGDHEIFENSRQMALAGLSAGGILYFIPQKNILFWEDRREISSDQDSKILWMSPAITTFANKFMLRMQTDIAQNSGRVYGSRRLGSLVMVVLNPAEAFGTILNEMLDRPKFSQGQTLIISQGPTHWTGGAPDDESKRSYIGLRFELHF